MLLVGLVIIVVGAVLLVCGVLGADVEGAQASIVGIDVSATTLFLLGLASGVLVLLGLVVAKRGAQRDLAQRKERKDLDQLSEKLDRADAGRRRDLDEDGN